jgi:hypothetical protein
MSQRIFITAITVDGKTCGKDAIRAGLAVMNGTFDNMTVASAIGRAGFEPDDLWVRQEIANRLLQKVRRSNLAACPDRKNWTACEGGVLAAVLKIEAEGFAKAA